MARAGSERSRVTDRFNPDMLKTAREARGLTQSALAQAVGVSQPLVGKWEAAFSAPDYDQSQRLADVLGVPAEFFRVDRPRRRLASMSDFYHRGFAKAKRSEVKSIHAKCSIVDLQVDRLLDLAGVPESRIPEVRPNNHAGDIERVALITRTAMGVPDGPIGNLIAAIEGAGGIVIDHDLEAEDIDALCRWVPELPKLFFINGLRSADRIRFSLAHELGHTVMHFGEDVEPRLAEQQANAFAGAFLMPRSEFRRDVRPWLGISDLAALKRKWRVSMSAIARRAHDLKAIDDQHYKSLCIQLAKRGWKKTEPVPIEGEAPRRFAQMIADHCDAGWTVEDLSRLLFVSCDEVRRQLHRVHEPDARRPGPFLRLTE